jgi:hypothetical protein
MPTAGDAGGRESLWPTYYERIFNPARLEARDDAARDASAATGATLPEGAVISPLSARVAAQKGAWDNDHQSS